MYTLYTITSCRNCQNAREHLQRLNIPYREVNIMENIGAAALIKHRVGEVIAPVLIGDDGVLYGEELLTWKG